MQVIHAGKRAAQAVAAANRGAQVVIGDFDAVKLFEVATEQLHILVPHIGLVRTALALRQVQHVRLLDLVKQLVHLLFAVARGFAHDHVRKIRERAFVGQREAVSRLDERTQVRGQHRFCRRNGLVRHAA